MKDIDDKSIDMILCEEQIVKMYEEEKYTLRHLADIFNTNHHRIKRILVKNNVKITRRNSLKKFSDEHRKKISESSKGRPGYWKGKKMPEETVRKNMVNHMKYDISIEDIKKYIDIEKLKFLTSGISRNLKHFNTKEIYLAYIDKFYNDHNFNKLYKLWLNNNKNKWYMPTLEHKISKFNGGSWELDNLQFLTWFENRTKAEMNQDEWGIFKIKTNTSSDLFI